jgi:hypothetical protein
MSSRAVGLSLFSFLYPIMRSYVGQLIFRTVLNLFRDIHCNLQHSISEYSRAAPEAWFKDHGNRDIFSIHRNRLIGLFGEVILNNPIFMPGVPQVTWIYILNFANYYVLNTKFRARIIMSAIKTISRCYYLTRQCTGIGLRPGGISTIKRILIGGVTELFNGGNFAGFQTLQCSQMLHRLFLFHLHRQV